MSYAIWGPDTCSMLYGIRTTTIFYMRVTERNILVHYVHICVTYGRKRLHILLCVYFSAPPTEERRVGGITTTDIIIQYLANIIRHTMSQIISIRWWDAAMIHGVVFLTTRLVPTVATLFLHNQIEKYEIKTIYFDCRYYPLVRFIDLNITLQ